MSSEPGVGVLNQPPLSPPSKVREADAAPAMPALRTVNPPAEETEETEPVEEQPTFGTPPQDMPIEAQLVRLGLLSVGQLAEAHRQRLETGRPVLEVAIEKGWLDAAEIERLGGPSVAVAAPAPPADEVEAEVAPEPAPVPEPEARVAEAPAPAPATKSFAVLIHLSDGERVEVDRVESEQRAETLAREVVAEVTRSGADKWPFYAGRFIRPDVIVSVDVVEGEITES
jgi:hypothetical protein